MNEKYPQALEDLMELLRGLPGVGRRSAERMAMHFFSWDDSRLGLLSDVLADLKKKVGKCSVCGNLADIRDDGTVLCPICASLIPPVIFRVPFPVVSEASVCIMPSGGSRSGLPVNFSVNKLFGTITSILFC